MPRLPDAIGLGERPVPRAPSGIVSIDAPRRPNVGDSLTSAGLDFAAKLEAETERINKLRAEDALNDLLNAEQDLSIGDNGFSKVMGGNAVTRPLAKDYTERFTQKRREIAGKLVNDQQRELFERRAEVVARSFNSRLLGHIEQQSTAYETQVLSGVEAAAVSRAAENYGDDAAVDTWYARYEFLAREIAQRRGIPEDVLNQSLAAVRDKVWASRLTAEAAQNPVAAYGRLTVNRDQLSAATYRALEAQLFQASDDLLAARAQQALPRTLVPAAAAPANGRDTLSRLFEAIVQVESGGNPDAVSPQGATGAAQITPATFKTFARQGEFFENEADRVTVARRKLAADFEFYGGDIEKTAAAYIGGRGAVRGDGSIRDDVKDAHGTTPLAYVGRVLKRMGLEKGGAAREQAQEALAVALATLTPADMEAFKTGDELIDALPPHRKLAVLQKAQTMARQESAQMREGVQARFQDSVAALERGLEAPGQPSPAELTLAFGQVDGTRRARELAEARQFGLDVKAVATMSPTEQAALVTARAPQAGDGFAVGQRRQEQLLRAIEQTNRARDADPGAFVIQFAPTVQRAYQAMSGAAPEARAAAAQAFAQASIAEQQRLGVTSPQILPKAMADQVVREFTAPRDGQAQSAAQFVQAQEAQWGRYWPDVYKQIAKDITPTARVVSNLRDTPAAAVLSMHAQMKTPELRKQIPNDDAKAIDETVDVELEPFRKSVSGWTTGGVTAFNDYDEAVKRLAYVYAAQGTKPADAAKRAARELVGDYYEFRGTARIPKAVDAQPVEAGMSAVLKGAETLGVRVPEAEAKRLGKDFTAKQMAASLRANGFFITLGDDSGVALYMQGANGARAVEGADGKPITFTWQVLAARARAATKEPGAVDFGTTPEGAATGRTIRRAR